MPEIETARAWYPDDDPVHGFDHVLRVLHTARYLAQAEGADWQIVCAAVLLHDAQPPQAGGAGTRPSHHHQAAEFARQVLLAEGWADEQIQAVQHCIRAHRFRDNAEPPATLEAKILFDADKLDAIGAVGVGRAIAHAARAGHPFYTRPSETFLQSGQLEPGEAHSAYHEYLYKLRKLHARLYTPAARRLGAERHRVMSAYFDLLAQESENDPGAESQPYAPGAGG